MDIKRIGPAAREINDTLIAAYRDQRGVHAETVIGAAAALAGEYALRATGLPLPEKGWIAGGAPDPLLYEGEARGQVTIWMMIREAAVNAGALPADLPDMKDVVLQTARAIGGSPFPPLTIPAEHFPHEWSPQAAPRFRAQIDRIRARHGLSAVEIALAIGFAIALLIDLTKDMLPPRIPARLAAEIMIGTSRMAPLQARVTAGR